MNIYRRKTSEFLALRRESALCAFRSLGTELQLILHSADAAAHGDGRRQRGRRRQGAQGRGRQLDDMLKILLDLSAPSSTLGEKWPAIAKSVTSLRTRHRTVYLCIHTSTHSATVDALTRIDDMRTDHTNLLTWRAAPARLQRAAPTPAHTIPV